MVPSSVDCGYPQGEHNPHIEGLDPELDLESALHAVRPCETWPLDRHLELVFELCVDEVLDMDLVQTVAEHNGHPLWRERVQFLRNFQLKKWFSMSRRTIDQVVQQEWFGAG